MFAKGRPFPLANTFDTFLCTFFNFLILKLTISAPDKPFQIRPNQFDGVQFGMVGWLGKQIVVCSCGFKALSSWNMGTLGLCICAYIMSKKMKEIIIIIIIIMIKTFQKTKTVI